MILFWVVRNFDAFFFFFFIMLVCFDSQGFWLGCVVHMQILMWVLALKDFVCVELNFWCNLVIFQFLDLFMLFIQTPKWGVWSFFSLFGIGGWWWLLVLLWPWILVAGGGCRCCCVHGYWWLVVMPLMLLLLSMIMGRR